MLILKRFVFISTLLFSAAQIASAQNEQFSWQHLPKVSTPVFKKDTLNIVNYGAKADGVTLNTQSINKAIADCSAKGGGVVLIPQGLWLTGPVVMKSNVNLYVSRAALLQFTDDKSQYPLVEGNYEGHAAVRNQSPISGTDLQNIAITGDGIIDGHGEAWRAIGKDRLTDNEWKALTTSGGVLSENGKTWYPSQSYVDGFKTPDAGVIQPGKKLEDYASMKDFFRPNMLVLTNCKKVLLQGVTFQNSPAWCLHTLICEDLTLENIHVKNPWNAQNGDGIDVESCKNVLIEGSTFEAGDDGICIKSGRDEEGRRRGKPTENMVVKNDVVYRAHGGFVIGSEMSGGARNIFVSDCTFIGTDVGLRFKTTRGRGGIVENIYIKNISMRNIVTDAILFDMYYMGKSPGEDSAGDEKVVSVTEATPQFRNFHVDNVICIGAEKGLQVRGLPEMNIKNINLQNLVLKTNQGIDIIEGTGISLKNVQLDCKNTSPLINIENSHDISFNNITYSNAQTLFTVSGKKSAQIKVSNTDVTKAVNKTDFKTGADNNSLTIVK
ncbi:Pectate lyase superfamily protein [Mucilaginibacter mallensis]|uniref:Pectate lyase superfamily protein n=1 Tax=Mucilaginibacter mallensis TaxID=652787 RepID=A0A1H1Y461_MUCMA|nr:glycoside hydrolase family 28 protein [Mucilaginibacter mallensis]SDT16201.1 Pectate lyase superfamily protein [Mucilaginibacter mallensis]